MRSINARHRFWTVDGPSGSNASGLVPTNALAVTVVLLARCRLPITNPPKLPLTPFLDRNWHLSGNAT
jgi:hypothetical protein